MEATSLSVDRGMDKDDVVCAHTHIYYYSAIKKNEMMPFAATQMDLESVILSEIREKEKYHMTSLMCGIQKKRCR